METAGPRGGVQRHDGGDRPARAARAAGAVPALDGLRRHADPARLVAVAITLLPVVLATRRARGSTGRTAAPTTRASRAWTRWAEPVVAPPLGRGRASALAVHRRAGASPRWACSSAPPTLDTIAQVGRAPRPGSTRSSAPASARARWRRTRSSSRRDRPGDGRGRACAGVDGIHGAVAPDGAPGARGGTAVVDAVPVSDSDATPAARALDRRARRRPRAPARTCASAGSPAANADFIDAVYGSFPLMLALIGDRHVHAAGTRVPLAAAAR